MFRILKKNLEIGKATLSYPPARGRIPQESLGAPEIDSEKCTGCGQCVAVCPTDALSLRDRDVEDTRSFFLSYGSCIFCGLCGPSTCPYEAISFTGKFELAAKTKSELTLEFPFQLSKCRKDPAFLPAHELAHKELPAGGPCFKQGDFSHLLSLDEIGSQLKSKIKKLLKHSLHIREVDAGSCNGCEIEVANLSNPIYDMERFGIHMVASPRHADMLLVTGPVTRQMELALVKTYEATPSPKWVVACGSCAISGGIFKGSYAGGEGVAGTIPVDVYIPGCPPRPEAILQGIFLALDKAK
ncbi:MAG: NADH-quinone oxidoreductase subunit NuoB [Candidatus Omnitrophica bacterium]|nr:NADH-quinone oxidoreductase subunit NuoB [Candidatus Omnitrophota bacterium]